MDARDLYGLPLERFVPERTALARDLRRAGQREEAEAVAALRKPSLAAWAVNQLVRTQGRAVARLFQAGDAAQLAQTNLLSGRGAAVALRGALMKEREAVSQLVEVARGLLSSEGHELSSSMLERVANTLHAAALDEESRASVRDGCLERELRHVGLGPPAGVTTPGGRRGRPARSAPPRAMGELRKAEAAARRGAERAEKDLDAARSRREAAAQALAEAQDALAAAEEAVGAAERRAGEAHAAHELARRNLQSA